MNKNKYAGMDPLEEIRAIREEISSEFKSNRALGEYLRNRTTKDTSKKLECREQRSSKKVKGRSPSPRRKQTAKAYTAKG